RPEPSTRVSNPPTCWSASTTCCPAAVCRPPTVTRCPPVTRRAPTVTRRPPILCRPPTNPGGPMPDSPLSQALASASDTRAIEAGPDVLDRCGEVFTRTFGTVTALPVADENTWNVAGQQVVDSLRRAGIEVSDPLLFPAAPAPYAS